MPASKACLTCKHICFITPEEWKPGYKGDEFDKFDACQIIRKTKKHLKARCSFNPVWIDVTTGHYCGQWNGLEQENNASDFIWGSAWRRENNELHDEIKALKTQLKNSRRISTSRLARLKSSSKDVADKGKNNHARTQ